MPEGPEIHREADQLRRALAGRETTCVAFAFADLEPWEERLSERVVDTVEARGKAILVRFAGGVTVYSHNQLYGRWRVVAAGERPETRRQLRLAIDNDSKSALLYSASEIEVLETAAAVEAQPYLARLGPDLLAPTTDLAVVRARVADPRFARRRLGGLLLDQGFLAGLGNYLRSEILHVACLHPLSRPVDLDPASLDRLAETALTLTRRSYETGGSTNDPERVAAAKAKKRRRSSYRFYVFARAGKRCYTCGTKIERHEIAGRRLFLCPTCQSAPGAS